MRQDNESVLFKPGTGEIRPFPEGHAKNVAADVMELKLRGYDEAVEVVRTASGSRRHVCIASSVGGPKRLARDLARQRPDGHPTFLRASEWDRLSATEKAALLETPEAEA